MSHPTTERPSATVARISFPRSLGWVEGNSAGEKLKSVQYQELTPTTIRCSLRQTVPMRFDSTHLFRGVGELEIELNRVK